MTTTTTTPDTVTPEPPLPPGPRGPVIVQFMRWVLKPIETMHACQREFGDSFTLRAPGAPPLVFVSDPHVIKDLWSGDPERLCGDNRVLRPVFGDGSLMLLNGARHQRERRLIMSPLHGARMHAYGPTMAAITERAMARWPIGKPFALRTETQAITLEAILRAVFGVERDDEVARFTEELQPVLHIPEQLGLLFVITGDGRVRLRGLQERLGRLTPWGRLHQKLTRIDRLLYGEIARRRADAEGRQDVLSMLITARDESGAGLSDRSLRDHLLELLIAGHETSANALSLLFHHLAKNPEVLARVQAEVDAPEREGGPRRLDYLDAAIKETLRLTPVIPFVGRAVTEPVTLGGRSFPAGVVLAPCIYLTHRRADLWPDPERFEPRRFLDAKPGPSVYFPFGGGSRLCVGMAFALYEMRIVASTVLRRFNVAAAPGYRFRLGRRGVTFGPDGDAPVVVTPRS